MHFSPRPNRAHEIRWHPWGAQPFELAQQSKKPLLLSISAVWCHWCHVMDETTYSDPAVIEKINEAFVPVRVDNDERPDINARYNQGGWPTTAFLTSDGLLIAGATYLPPPRMLAALDQIDEFYKANQEVVRERSAGIRERAAQQETRDAELSLSMIERVHRAIESRFDEEYAGFGDDQKFPMTPVLEFLLQEFEITKHQRLYDMVARTMLAMSSGGMYDPVEGGFFRYSTTRDWSIPHFEKMTEDHAALIRILAQLVRTTNNEAFRTTLVSSTAYVRDVLRDPNTGLFRGSQDADEAYYALPLEERRNMTPPYVDPRSYTNWTSAMGAAFISAGDVLADDQILAYGTQALDAVHALLDERGLAFHLSAPGAPPAIRGLLTDQAAYLRALLEGHRVTGESRFFERAVALADAVIERFRAPGGGFFDHASVEEPIAALAFADRPLDDNALVADSLLRLAAMSGDDRWREVARQTLHVFAQSYERAGLFAASYARAVRRYLTPAPVLTLAGTAQRTQTLREAALNFDDPLLDIHTSLPSDGQEEGHAYLCIGTQCAAPASDVQTLRSAFEVLVV